MQSGKQDATVLGQKVLGREQAQASNSGTKGSEIDGILVGGHIFGQCRLPKSTADSFGPMMAPTDDRPDVRRRAEYFFLKKINVLALTEVKRKHEPV